MKLKTLEFRESKEWVVSDEWEARPSDWLVFRIKKYSDSLFTIDMFCGSWTSLRGEFTSLEEAKDFCQKRLEDMIFQVLE